MTRGHRNALGAVLAGGEARRFGGRKAAALFLGEPLVSWPARALAGACPEVVVVGARHALPPRLAFRIVPDRIAGRGPLGGLHAALAEALERGRAGVLAVGCDMPLVTAGAARALLEAAARLEPEAPAVPARDPSGRAHPLFAWYATECLAEVERRLEGAERSLEGLLAAVGARPVEVPGAVLAGANTRRELARLEGLARSLDRFADARP